MTAGGGELTSLDSLKTVRNLVYVMSLTFNTFEGTIFWVKPFASLSTSVMVFQMLNGGSKKIPITKRKNKDPQSCTSSGNHECVLPIHIEEVNIFHRISENVDLQRIIKVTRLHHLGATNIYTKCHDNPSQISQDIFTLKQSGRLTD